MVAGKEFSTAAHTIGRRSVLQFGGTIGLASYLSGCLNVPVDGESSRQTEGDGPTGEAVNTNWELRAAALRATGLYTSIDPGIWAGKELSHTPALSIDASGTVATVEVPHEMDSEEPHWITAIWIEDQNGVVVGMRELGPNDVAARVQFPVRAGTTLLTAYAHCNLHDTWMSLPKSASGIEARPEWEFNARLLEETGVYSAQAPGIWTGREASHVPILTVNNGVATVRTEHEMVDDHRTDAIWIRTDNVVTGFATFPKPATTPEFSFQLPVGAQEVVAFAHCNQHDTWRSDPVTLT
ncbi:MAG: desulfoferrodoxin family protein [Myxococcota bacterium]